VTDIFRENKAAAGFYKSQCDPAEEIVLEPAFHWANSDESVGFSKAVVCSNCDHLKFYLREDSDANKPWDLIFELDPDRTEFEHLTYPPFILDRSKIDRKNRHEWGDLKIEGYIKGKLLITKTLSGAGVDQKFALLPDDTRWWAMVRIRRALCCGDGRVRGDAGLCERPYLVQTRGPATLIGTIHLR